eukprot:TRINITY_DN198_c0_g1_i1.p2 TRINITY_DN198_c0_g1~~TRINITY_DN198_c0_g1_i1.p2  ORF type:complete len:248 (+),score=103.41 TRINITY_DN198_c0_g1_i1:74-817(+)
MAQKIALVTGANRGLGLELAKQLALEHNYHVLATARVFNDEEQKTFASLHEEAVGKGTSFRTFALDVSDEKSILDCAAQISQAVDHIDLLINNAGILHDERKLADVSTDNLLAAFKVNAIGPILLIRALLPLVRAGAEKKVVNVSTRMSSIADNGSGGSHSYRSSKSALNMLTKDLAIEFTASEGLIFGLIHPGMIYTRMISDFVSLETPGVVTAEAGAKRFLNVVAGLTIQSSGKLLSWDGSELPW